MKHTNTNTNTNTYHYCSRLTGELQTNLFGVIKTIWTDLFKFHLVNFRWAYSKEGF